MSDQTIPTPDFTDISPEAQKAAQAAMSQGAPLRVPDFAKKATDKKGEEYFRWNESAVIEQTWREGTKDGLIVCVIQYKIRSGNPNEHQRNWVRHTLNPRGLSNQWTNDDEKKKHEFMNNLTINALSSLFAATGYAPKTPGLRASLLQMMFPKKGEPGAAAPIIGKTVILNLCDAPAKGENVKYDRRTNVESYLPEASA